VIEKPLLLNLPSEIRTARLTLRSLRAGDGDELFAAFDESRAHLSAWMPWLGFHSNVPDTEAYCRRMVAHWSLRTDLVFGFWLQLENGGQRYIGGGGLHQFDWQVPSAMLGYFLCQPFVGRGYMAEAAQGLIDFGFQQCKLSRVWASCDTRNDRSLRVMERIGMQREGTHVNDARDHHGKLRSTHFYALTRA
jgi:ribosomal-protein-serine acetyltransferase